MIQQTPLPQAQHKGSPLHIAAVLSAAFIMGGIILTNRKWFQNYLIGRRVILLIMIFSIFAILKPEIISPDFKRAVQSILIPLLITLLLFNYVQKPVLFEVLQDGNGMTIGLYKPDLQYAILKKNKLRYFYIKPKDKVIFEFSHHFIPLLNKGFITVIKENGEITRFQPINFAWASKKDLEIFNRAIDKHNKTLPNK